MRWSTFVDRWIVKQPRVRKFLTKLLDGDKDTRIRLLEIDLQINTIKENGYLRASRLVNSSSLLRDEVPVLINLAALLESGDTFVDVGANVGVYARTVSRLATLLPDVKIYAFEASPDTFSRLAVGIPSNVRAQQLAISAENGTLDFVSGAVSHVFTTVEKANQYSLHERPQQITAMRLDECEIQGDSMVIKVDVEGQEYAVLLGAKNYFDHGRVKAVYLDGYGDKPQIEGFLAGYGFSFLDGRSLLPANAGTYSLLAVKK